MIDPIDEFGKKIMESVRDPALVSASVLKHPSPTSPPGKLLARYDKKMVEEVVDYVACTVADAVLFKLLISIDNKDIELTYRDESVNQVDLCKEGVSELAMELWGEEGWITKYSAFKES